VFACGKDNGMTKNSTNKWMSRHQGVKVTSKKAKKDAKTGLQQPQLGYSVRNLSET